MSAARRAPIAGNDRSAAAPRRGGARTRRRGAASPPWSRRTRSARRLRPRHAGCAPGAGPRPIFRQAGFVEKRLGLLQILFAEDTHAHALGLRLAARALENEAVMTRLGDAAKIEGIPVFVADDEAEEIHVEVSAHRQILHGEHR